MFFRNFVPRLWFWPVRAKTQPRNKIPEKHFFLRGFHRTGCKLLIQYLLSGRQRFRQVLVENLIGGDCCHCDGGKTKSTPSLLALGLGWSLTIIHFVWGITYLAKTTFYLRSKSIHSPVYKLPPQHFPQSVLEMLNSYWLIICIFTQSLHILPILSQPAFLHKDPILFPSFCCIWTQSLS